MLTIDVSHPDSEKFITSKDDLTKITGANISLKITNEFMEAVKNNIAFKLKFKDIEVSVMATKVWNKIIHQAWKTAEPGVLFWDNIIKESPAACYGKEWMESSTNPCGEIPLCPYDSCRLGSMNIYSYVENPFTKNARFNDKLFSKHVMIAQRMMDNIVDLEEEKIKSIMSKIYNDPEDFHTKSNELQLWNKIKSKLLQGRRTGLGITGMADALAALNYTYGSELANNAAEQIMKMMAIASYSSSIEMAEERGAFPIWDINKESKNPYINRILSKIVEYDVDYKSDYFISYSKYGRRNIANLTIAPNGSISILAQTSSGIEPVFNLSYTRRRKVSEDNENKTFKDDVGVWWEEYDVYHHKYQKWLDMYKDQEIDCPYNNATANEIDYLSKIEMQGKVQQWIDHSISITHNLPSDISEEEVSKIYFKAWESGCKGCTIYREGSRSGVLVNKETKEEKFEQRSAPKRPKTLKCEIHTPRIKGDEFVVVVGLMQDKPYEVFAAKNIWNIKGHHKGEILKRKRGIYDVIINEAITIQDITKEMSSIEEDKTRLISVALRHGANIKFLVEQLNKASGNGFQDFSKVIARTLKKYIIDDETVSGEVCPECGGELSYGEGCVKCKNCGFTKC